MFNEFPQTGLDTQLPTRKAFWEQITVTKDEAVNYKV